MSYNNLEQLASWKKITKTFADFSAAALTSDIEVYSLAAKEVVHSIVVKHSAAFGGGVIAAYTVSVGISGSLAKYSLALDVFQAPSNTVFQLGVALPPTVENFGSATSIRAAAIAVGGLLNTATQGAVDFYILTSKLP